MKKNVYFYEKCNKTDRDLLKPCPAVHHEHPECDCRWCVYNEEFNQAHGHERES